MHRAYAVGRCQASLRVMVEALCSGAVDLPSRHARGGSHARTPPPGSAEAKGAQRFFERRSEERCLLLAMVGQQPCGVAGCWASMVAHSVHWRWGACVSVSVYLVVPGVHHRRVTFQVAPARVRHPELGALARCRAVATHAAASVRVGGATSTLSSRSSGRSATFALGGPVAFAARCCGPAGHAWVAPW